MNTPVSNRFRFRAALLLGIVAAPLVVHAGAKLPGTGQTDPQPLQFPKVQEPTFPNRTFNIRDFGAIGDGKTMNTESIARAISACVKAGGGRVVIPAGIWATGPIRLAGNLDLHVERGALVVFSSNVDDYPLIDTWFEGQPGCRRMSPIYGTKLENVAVTGEGIFDGSGDAWRPVKKFKTTEGQWKNLLASGGVVDPPGTTWWPSAAAMGGAEYLAGVRQIGRQPDMPDCEKVREYLRPVLLQLSECRKVLIDGPTFQNSPAWNLHPLMSEDLTIRNVTVRNPWYAQNGDGLDLESCRNVAVYNCRFDVGDDAICLKSGRDEAGRRRGLPTENVRIHDCVVYHGHGGFVIGSEMSGGVRNVDVRDCTFIGTDTGLRFKSTRGRGGVVENIRIERIFMQEIAAAAITFNLFYGGQAPISEPGQPAAPRTDEAVPVGVGTPQFRTILISEVICRGAEQAVELLGLPEQPLQNIEMREVSISAVHGMRCANVNQLRLEGVEILSQQGPVMAFHNGTNVSIAGAGCAAGTEVFVALSGSRTANIQLRETDLSQARTDVLLAPEVNPTAVSRGR